MVNVTLTVRGSILQNGHNILEQSAEATVTTSLAMKPAQLASKAGPNSTSFDLYIDILNPSALHFRVNDPNSGIRALIESALTNTWNASNPDAGTQCIVASLTLANDMDTSLASNGLIPHFADFSFVQDTTNQGHSNLLILMLSLNEFPNASNPNDFAAPLLPPDQDYMVLMSNQIFLQNTVLPAVVPQIQGIAKDPNAVPTQITLQPLPEQYMK
jgi:hypothetical protein